MAIEERFQVTLDEAFKAGQLVEMGAVLLNFAEEGNGDAAE